MRAVHYTCAIIGLLVVGGICAEESFVKQPRKRHSGQGLSSLKEYVGKVSAEFVGSVPGLSRAIANLQESAFNCVSELIQGNKKGLIASASEQDLMKLKEIFERCNKTRQVLGDELREATQTVRNMVEKYGIECRV